MSFPSSPLLPSLSLCLALILSGWGSLHQTLHGKHGSLDQRAELVPGRADPINQHQLKLAEGWRSQKCK